jgi:hypothetical protein
VGASLDSRSAFRAAAGLLPVARQKTFQSKKGIYQQKVVTRSSIDVQLKNTNDEGEVELWVVKKLSDLEMSELRRIKDSTVLPLNLAVKTLLLT